MNDDDKRCPECGGEMEKGVVSAVGLSMAWSKEPILTILRGVAILKRNPPRLTYIEGNRCKACRLIIAHYQSDDLDYSVGNVFERFYSRKIR
jgi:hypothetical protein